MYTIYLTQNDAKIIEDAIKIIAPDRFEGIFSKFKSSVRYYTGVDNEESKRYITKLTGAQLLPHLDLCQCDLHLIDASADLLSNLELLPETYHGYIFYGESIYYKVPGKSALDVATLDFSQSQQFKGLRSRLVNTVAGTQIAWQEELELIESFTNHRHEASSLSIVISDELVTRVEKKSQVDDIATTNIQKSLKLLPAKASLYVANNIHKITLDNLYSKRNTILNGSIREKKELLKENNKSISWFGVKYNNDSLLKKFEDEIKIESVKAIETVSHADINYLILMRLHASKLPAKPRSAINSLLKVYDSAYSKSNDFYDCLELTTLISETYKILSSEQPQKARQLNILLEPYINKANTRWQKESLAEQERSSLLFNKVLVWLSITIIALSISIIFCPEALLLFAIGVLAAVTLPDMDIDENLEFYEQSHKLAESFIENKESICPSDSYINTYPAGKQPLPPAYQQSQTVEPSAPPSEDIMQDKPPAYSEQRFFDSNNSKYPPVNGALYQQPSAPPSDELEAGSSPRAYQ